MGRPFSAIQRTDHWTAVKSDHWELNNSPRADWQQLIGWRAIARGSDSDGWYQDSIGLLLAALNAVDFDNPPPPGDPYQTPAFTLDSSWWLFYGPDHPTYGPYNYYPDAIPQGAGAGGVGLWIGGNSYANLAPYLLATVFPNGAVTFVFEGGNLPALGGGVYAGHHPSGMISVIMVVNHGTSGITFGDPGGFVEVAVTRFRYVHGPPALSANQRKHMQVTGGVANDALLWAGIVTSDDTTSACDPVCPTGDVTYIRGVLSPPAATNLPDYHSIQDPAGGRAWVVNLG